MKIFIKTYGCQMNERDSEAFAGMLVEAGHTMVDSEEQADVLLFNTCSVREQAERKAIGKIGFMKKLKAKHPELIIGAMGCMAQRLGNDLLKELPHLDFVLGTGQLHTLVPLIESIRADRRQVASLNESEAVLTGMGSHYRPAGDVRNWHAQIAITRGCNRFCSYCIVPYVRGRERSREPEDIIKEIEGLVADGVVEVMLLGQNVNSYGKNLENPITFAELLRRVEKIEGLERIRFMTSHPKDLSEELIDAMRDCEKVCLHLHLPLQSGSSRILKLMNRRYTKEQYLNLVDRIRAKVPDVSLTTDIIVGFPGETEEDFLETMDVVRKVRYDSAFTFQYSRRTGTPAAAMEDQIPVDVVKDRFDRLLAEVQEISREVTARHTHTVQEVLVESINEQDPSLVTGRMSNNTLVHFKGDASLIGTLQNVYLDECRGFYYMGTPVENN